MDSTWFELKQERDAAEHVKRDKKILVILGNPPYNAFAGVSPEEEQGLVEPYKKDLNKPVGAGGWGIKKFNLDDLYVRFFRLAERRIAEMSGKGVVSFISNHSWISEPSFVVLRQHLLESFDKFWIENLHGNRKISEYAPDGRTSETIFAISGFSVGIQQGVATSLWVKTGKPRRGPAQVRFRDDIDDAKAAERRKHLLASLTAKRFNKAYPVAKPRPENRFSLRPENVSAHYTDWPKVIDLCAVSPFNGPVERRGGSLISIDRGALEERMAAYFDSAVVDSEVAILHPSLMMTGNRIVGPLARQKLLQEHSFSLTHRHRAIRSRCSTCDGDTLRNIRPLFREPSPQLLKQRFSGNSFFITRDTADKSPEGPPFFFSQFVCDYDAISGHARHFPILLKNGSRLEKEAEATLFAALGDKPEEDKPVANLSARTREYLLSLKIKNPEANAKMAGLVWMHALAIGYSPAYLSENADGIRRDWPRIPVPDFRKALEASAVLGEQIAALLDTETDVPGVTSGKFAPVLKTIGPVPKPAANSVRRRALIWR